MKRVIIFATALMTIGSFTVAQAKKKIEPKVKQAYEFTDVKVNSVTSVKDQASSGTCWAYAGLSFVESELLRKNKGEHDLSDMWIVRHTYYDKAIKYARMNGTINLGPGGIGTDVFNVIEKYGVVPEEIYQGLNYGTDKNLHGELDKAIKSYMDAIISNPNRTLSTAWKNGLNAILDAYLGVTPEEFAYKGRRYTPQSFAVELGIKKEDYVSITSFTHHPFGTRFVLEIPDNFSWELLYNATLDQMMSTIDSAIDKGQTVLWSADVSEKGFQYHKGFAVLPAMKLDDMQDSEKSRWSGLSDREREAQMLKFDVQLPEINTTTELRQEWFDNYQTTDDHAMHIVGVAKDQNGKKYYKVKNSWNTTNIYQGYFYASEEYVKAKTLAIVVSRDATSIK